VGVDPLHARRATNVAITREQQRAKYEEDDRYHAHADDFNNMYSLRNPSGLYFETRRLRAFFELLNKHGITFASRRVLDVGCHYGLYTGLFAYLKRGSADVTGCDYIEAYLRTARGINGSLRFQREDLYELTFAPASFDFVLLNYVLSCIPPADAPAVSAELSKIVAREGYVLFFDFNYSIAWRALARITGRDRDPLPSFNDARIRTLFPEFDILSSIEIVPYTWRRMIDAGIPSYLLDVLEKIPMRQFYVALLRKR
jgi:SAM-dependent methyltransferase